MKQGNLHLPDPGAVWDQFVLVFVGDLFHLVNSHVLGIYNFTESSILCHPCLEMLAQILPCCNPIDFIWAYCVCQLVPEAKMDFVDQKSPHLMGDQFVGCPGQMRIKQLLCSSDSSSLWSQNKPPHTVC